MFGSKTRTDAAGAPEISCDKCCENEESPKLLNQPERISSRES